MLMLRASPQPHRVDHLLIAEMVRAGARVLDVGCGDGALLKLLADKRRSTAAASSVARARSTPAWRAGCP